ncbi:MAG: translation initiation factor IF-2 [Patescibacteria group bacterium]|nr:translation initiation factor IF-2 [Patescibacteria group bacterium]MDW8279856.1 translation initiation factor IF-2 [bacterium]
MIQDNKNNNLIERPPVIAVLGHVDHGKTSLLDYIRKTNIAAREAGGITQSIGAYEITHNGKKITFIDTPGHEAFIQMRSRGAKAADLAILVVAADDGVKPQTEESIKILNQTKTPFIVAITKIDKPNANIEKAKNDLMNAGVLLENYGGNIPWQAVSSITGEGINELLDLILLAAELEELKYSPENKGQGIILEAHHDSKRGITVTVILKNGKLVKGDFISTPTASGKIKILENFEGKPVNQLFPSSPARIIGFENLPQVGEEFICDLQINQQKNNSEIKQKIKTVNQNQEPQKVLNLILKAKDAGSLEALSQIIQNIKSNIAIKIIDESIGDIFDSDIKLAQATDAKIIAFNSKIPKQLEAIIRSNNIEIISSNIIYELIKIIEEKVKEIENPPIVGILEVLAVFNNKNLEKQIIGGKIIKGVFKNKSKFEIERGNEIINTGFVINLQSNKKDVSEVSENNEAGLMVKSQIQINIGDKLIIKK